MLLTIAAAPPLVSASALPGRFAKPMQGMPAARAASTSVNESPISTDESRKALSVRRARSTRWRCGFMSQVRSQRFAPMWMTSAVGPTRSSRRVTAGAELLLTIPTVRPVCWQACRNSAQPGVSLAFSAALNSAVLRARSASARGVPPIAPASRRTSRRGRRLPEHEWELRFRDVQQP